MICKTTKQIKTINPLLRRFHEHSDRKIARNLRQRKTEAELGPSDLFVIKVAPGIELLTPLYFFHIQIWGEIREVFLLFNGRSLVN